MSAAKLLSERHQVRAADRWNLTSLFASDGAWERAFARWEKRIAHYGPLRGTLGRSAAALARCLTFDAEFDRQGERLGTYAFLRTTTDLADSDCQMNYDPKVLDHVFTLAHEAGHSMHSYYSARTQPYPDYRYTIFVAEVASTVNEQLLSRYLMAKAKTRQQRAYLINREIDAIRATVWRQTMFAEFEQTTHALTEAGEPLTTERIKGLYGELLERYFGPDFALDDALRLECFRIPHFYRAFYVYKYATGLAAAIALADQILQGDRQQRGAYLDFLKAGCAKFPLELLCDAGVDLSAPTSVDAALRYFAQLVDELEMLLD